MALVIMVDSRGHEPLLAKQLRPWLDLFHMKQARIEVAQIPVGDVFWEAGSRCYAVERKALSLKSDDMAKSFGWGKGRLGRQIRRMQAATVQGRAALLVEGDIIQGPGDLIYDRESGAPVGWPLTWSELTGIMWRSRMEGLIAERTQDMDETAQVVARMIRLSTHPSRWLPDAAKSGTP